MLPKMIDKNIESLIDLALIAGEEILKIYNSTFETRFKKDNSPVTEADEIAEKIILSGLSNFSPHLPIISEEAYNAGHRPDISKGIFWLVDALDGTKEFINKRDEFTVNIALINDKKPVFGIIYAPALNILYHGGEMGAFKRNMNGSETNIYARTPKKEGITVTTSRSHRGNEDQILKNYKINNTIYTGSSIKLCLVAEGSADLYPRLTPTSEWDIAAGHAILIAAGGQLTQIDGTPFLYGKKNIINPKFIARGRMPVKS